MPCHLHTIPMYTKSSIPFNAFRVSSSWRVYERKLARTGILVSLRPWLYWPAIPHFPPCFVTPAVGSHYAPAQTYPIVGAGSIRPGWSVGKLHGRRSSFGYPSSLGGRWRSPQDLLDPASVRSRLERLQQRRCRSQIPVAAAVQNRVPF